MTGPESPRPESPRPLLDRVFPPAPDGAEAAAAPEGMEKGPGKGAETGGASGPGSGPGRAAFRGERCFPADEPFFAGHFPGLPVVPGVFLLEALAECARQSLAAERPDRRFVLTGVTGVRFRRRVEPGDRVQFEARPVAASDSEPDSGADSGAGRFRAEASVNGQRAVEATLEFR